MLCLNIKHNRHKTSITPQILLSISLLSNSLHWDKNHIKMNIVPYLYLHREMSLRYRETSALRWPSLLLTGRRLHTGVHAKYANIFKCHLVLPEKNLTCSERDLGRRLRLEDHRFEASINCISKPGLQKSKEKEKKERMDGRKEGSQNDKWACRKEGESFTVLDTQ